jgi:hypothetical protein
MPIETPAAGERKQPERDSHRIPPALQEAHQCGDEEEHVEQALRPNRREDERVGAEGDERELA